MKTFKPLLLSVILSVSSVSAVAGGIPVHDAAANLRDFNHQAKEVIQMGKEVKQWADTIKHYTNELKQLKDTHNALSGLKKLVSFDPDLQELVSSFEDLMSGNPDRILSRAEKYFDHLEQYCDSAKNKQLCEQASLSEIVQQDYSEKLSNRLDKELKNIEALQRKAANAMDTKSIAEVQAAIALQQNKIQLLAIHADNFHRFQQAQKEIAQKQARQKLANAVWESRKAYINRNSMKAKNTGYTDLFK